MARPRIGAPPDDLPALRARAVQSVDDTGLRPTAREIGISPTWLANFCAGQYEHPYTSTLRRLRKWAQRYPQEQGE